MLADASRAARMKSACAGAGGGGVRPAAFGLGLFHTYDQAAGGLPVR
ncbi:MAG: hypothetical protein M0C28_28460 [Candidatus Moduliflexus flocculans]|nr:hypothetical protein [Candidatus Moduliflexus flocculans]